MCGGARPNKGLIICMHMYVPPHTFMSFMSFMFVFMSCTGRRLCQSCSGAVQLHVIAITQVRKRWE